MSQIVEVKVPDIGDFKDVEVIEVLVKPATRSRPEQSLITVESDKASMEIPSSAAGVVKEMKVKLGDKVSQGSLMLVLDGECRGGGRRAAGGCQRSGAGAAGRRGRCTGGRPLQRRADLECEVLVLGAGPGGYSAAFRAADLG
jgi:dihydrolipoamide dehydrogenase